VFVQLFWPRDCNAEFSSRARFARSPLRVSVLSWFWTGTRRARLTGLSKDYRSLLQSNDRISFKPGGAMSQSLVVDAPVEEAKNLARILYVVHGLTFFFSLGLLSFLPLIVNYVKRPYTEGTLVYSHHTWMIRSFWFYALWMIAGCALFITIIGIPLAYLIWGVAWLWKAYRLIKGFVDLNNNRPMPV
jgi:uncharacterized membrane protein